MHAQTPKQDALHAIERLPDDVPLDEIVYRLYVLSKVQQGVKDIDAGRTVSTDELARDYFRRAQVRRRVLDLLFAAGEYADVVREREQFWQRAGIHSVPSIVVDGRHLIQGGQPPEVFEQALRQIAAQAAT